MTLGIYSLLGFIGGAAGPLAVGALVDLGGGFGSTHAWYLGFAAMGTGSVLAAIAISFVAIPAQTTAQAGAEGHGSC